MIDENVTYTGYNGSLPGLPHCDDAGCLIVDDHCVRTNHAEMNAIAQAARHGISINGATAYITNMPCTTCAKALLSAGIVRIAVFSDYHGSLAEKFLEESGVPLDRLSMPGRSINYNLEDYSSASKF